MYTSKHSYVYIHKSWKRELLNIYCVFSIHFCIRVVEIYMTTLDYSAF
jgi:hypothetical protein